MFDSVWSAPTVCAVAFSALVSLVPAQQSASGYSEAVIPFGPSVTAALEVPGGSVYYDGFALVYDQGTGSPTNIFLPGPLFPSFLMLLDPGHVLMGESSQGNLYVVPLSGSGVGPALATLPFNYDAERLDANTLVVSAKLSGFGTPDNDLVTVDLTTGSVATLGSVPGASGPLVVTPTGGLLYATGSLAFPPPMGSTEVLYWSPAQVAAAHAGGAPLDYLGAQRVMGGLEGFSDMILDGDGDLVFSDYTLARVGEIDDVLGPRPKVKTLVDYSGVAARPGSLQYFPGGTSDADFEPYQYSVGGRLRVAETDFISLYDVREIVPQHAGLGVVGMGPQPSILPGPFTVEITGGAPGGMAFLVLSLLPATLPDARLSVVGFEQVIGWNPAMTMPLASVFVTLDGQGRGQWPAINPGLGRAGISIQAAFADSAVETIGSTPADDLILL